MICTLVHSKLRASMRGDVRKYVGARNYIGVLLIVALVGDHARPSEVVPLENAHAHNDYEHVRPLLDALDEGFTSVEADVFPVGGDLLVGHDEKSLKPTRTLEDLYLKPLAERVRRNGSHVYSRTSRFFFLIDIKDKPQEAYRILQRILPRYSEMLTAVERGKLREGAITIVLTGNRPEIKTDASNSRCVALDGRLTDLDSRQPAHLMAMISDDWSKHFRWNGKGPIPADERAELRRIVTKAHSAGRVVRFWKTPENETVWRELRSNGVDLINTDQLARLATFLRNETAQAKQRCNYFRKASAKKIIPNAPENSDPYQKARRLVSTAMATTAMPMWNSVTPRSIVS
jgi:hypothetical protein